MCILLYVKFTWCNGISDIYGCFAGVGVFGDVSVWGWVHLTWVYVHSAICKTYWVEWYCIDVWSIGGGGSWYMCILLYVKFIRCSGIAEINCQLEEGCTYALGICAFCYMVYVHSAICEIYLV